ncbi:MAG TPA: YceI family protein [Minicystis sp.]|nr:YceI family protein [Minicystis sp.]
MTRTRSRSTVVLALALAPLALAGCSEKSSAPLAPTASALATAKPASKAAEPFTVDKATSKVEFMMEAPKEKIRGRVTGGTEGTLEIDPTDVTKTTGLITVDLGGLEVFQTTMGDDGKPGEETKNELQNKHARTWLEISDDAPEAQRKANSRVEFSIQKIDQASEKDVSKMTGADRKVTLKASGEFLLHGRKSQKTAELEATFHYEGGRPVSVTVKTTKPFAVGLAEHEVQPREAFGKLAAKTLDVLAPKVAKEALVSVDFTAKGGPAKAGAP